jgi:hypothetical protein
MSTSNDDVRQQFDLIVADFTPTQADAQDEAQSLDADRFWRGREGYRNRRTRHDLNALLHYGHAIPVRHGWTRDYIEEHFPGWNWNDLLQVFRAAGIVVYGGRELTVDEHVVEFYFDSITSWLVRWDDGHMTCGPSAPGSTVTPPKGSGYPDGKRASRSLGWNANDAAAELLPWKVRKQHLNSDIMRRFRTIARQQNDQPTTDHEEDLLHAWLEALSELNVVVAYHPNTPPNIASSEGGFSYVDRRPEDVWIVRDPFLQ